MIFTEALPVLSILLWLANPTAGYVAPSPSGKYNITLTTGALIDYSRNDPYAATPTPRALMLSVFQPATCASTENVPYMPRTTANYQGPALKETFNITFDLSPLFLGAELPVCPRDAEGCSPLEDGPILLFSPGYSIPRLYYSVLASSFASKGFTVITIDHTEDANIIVYPDGHAIYNNASILDVPAWDTYVRAADVSFLIDQLSNTTAIAELLSNRGPRTFPIDRIAMLGHSAGGATAILAASQDDRIRAAINWDGSVLGKPDLSGTTQPVLFMAREDTAIPSWVRAWPQLEGPKLIVRVANTTHQTFSDIPTLFEANDEDLTPYAELLGTFPPARVVRMLTAVTAAWMNAAFTGKKGTRCFMSWTRSTKFRF